jgi:hypothetical protein
VPGCALGVSNGLFTVALDFGSGIFDGNPRWLEIGVRTNAGVAFAVLSPRQPLTPAPYAIYAGGVNAAGISGTILAGNIGAGTITANMLAPGAAAAAITSSYYLTETQLNNAQWIALQASRLDDNTNYNRFGWKHTLAKIASGQTIRMELDGSGLVGQGILNGAFDNLTNKFPIAGYFTPRYPVLYTGSGCGGCYGATGKDSNWFAPYLVQTNIGANVALAINYSWNVLEIDCLAHPQGGTFKLQTNINTFGGYADAGVTINTSNNTTIGKSYFWTNSGVFPLSNVQLVQTTAGTNYILNFGAWNTNVTGGIMFGIQANSSTGVAWEILPSTNITGPIYATWNPDIIFWQSIEGTNISSTTNLQAWLNFYRTTLPNADIVLCGTYPVAMDVNDIPGQNAIIRSNAVALGLSYFDGWGVFQSWTNAVSRGFAPSSGPHYNQSGYDAYGYFLYRWLALDYAQLAITGDGLTSHATNFGSFTGGWTNTSGKNVSVTLTNATSAAWFDAAGVNWLPASLNVQSQLLQPLGYVTNATGGGFWHAQ